MVHHIQATRHLGMLGVNHTLSVNAQSASHQLLSQEELRQPQAPGAPRLQLLWENFLLSVVSFLQSTGLEVSHSPPCAAMETLFVTSKTLNTSHAPDLPDSEIVSARQYQNPGLFPKQHGLFCDPGPALVCFFLWALPPCPQPTK